MTVDVWPLTKEQRRALAVSDIACGTPEGYRLHRHQHTDPCPPCAWAWDASPGCTPVPRRICGTNEGWTAHRKRLEWPCGRCAEAREQHALDLCGSYAGWMLHRNSGTVVCDRCRDANRRYTAARGERSGGRRYRTLSGRLLRERGAGAVLVCTRPGFTGRAVSYAPRSLRDKYPWMVDPGLHISAREVLAVRPENGTAS